MKKIITLRSCFLVILTLTFFGKTSSVSASDFYKDVEKKQVAKDAKRWSLSEWLEQKKNNQLMDTWLMFNSPSPYEFFFGLDTATFKKLEGPTSAPVESTHRNYRASFAAYATIIGLYGEYDFSEDESEQWKGLLLLRLLGSSDQSTNFSVHYGLMGRQLEGLNAVENWRHQVAGGKFYLYLLKAFALTGRYEHYIRATSDESQITAQGNKYEAGAHLEYGALRFYGFWFQEEMELDGSSQRNTEGIQFGARVYF